MVSVMSQSWCWPLKLNTGVGLRTQGVSEMGLDCWWVDLELQKVLTLVLACCSVGLGSGRSGANVGSLVIGTLFLGLLLQGSGSSGAGVSQPVDKAGSWHG